MIDYSTMSNGQLDALAAERVMGYMLHDGAYGIPGKGTAVANAADWSPTTDPRDRDALVEAMVARGVRCQVETHSGVGIPRASCVFYRISECERIVIGQADDDTLGRAVVRAALVAVRAVVLAALTAVESGEEG